MTKPLFYKYTDYFREAPMRTGTEKMDHKYFWIWLSLAFNSNASTYSDKVLFEFGSVENVFYATEEMLREAFPEDERLVKRLANKSLTKAIGVATECERKNIGILIPTSMYYPTSLKSIPARPMVLYYKGSIPEFRQHLCVSVVGTRRASQYGSNSAYTISYDLAKSGAIVISGMADGIDGISHRAALDAMGQTIAVLGSGVDVIYPKNNTPLYNELLLKGLILSEYPPGSAPEGWHFPQRNRIISALSSATLVVEAAAKSGALITAEYAKKQGKLLYAVPGKVGEFTSSGTNDLIRSGAKMTTCANDILSDFYSLYNTLMPANRFPADPPQIHNVARTVKNNIATEASNPVPFLDNSAGYMSMEVDPRIEEARRNHEAKVKAAQTLVMKYPDEPLTDDGYTVESYAPVHPKTRKIPSVKTENGNTESTKSETTPTKKRVIRKVTAPAEPKTPTKTPSVDLSKLSENERKVVEYIIAHGKASMDELTSLGLSIQDITFVITMLEISGTLKSIPGGYCTLNEN